MDVPDVAPTSNVVCPISGLPAAPDVPTAAHGDRTVGFCSRECPVVWNLMSDADKDHLLKQGERNRKHVRRQAH